MKIERYTFMGSVSAKSNRDDVSIFQYKVEILPRKSVMYATLSKSAVRGSGPYSNYTFRP